MSLHEALQFIQPAIATKDTQAGLRYVRIAGGTVAAGNGAFSASAPCALNFECLVDGEKFCAALERMEDPEATLDGGLLKIKRGRLRASLNTLPTAGTDIPAPEGEWQPVPYGLMDALRLLRPFAVVGHAQPWATGLYLNGRTITATTGTIIVEANVAALALDAPMLLPAAAADFPLAQSNPDAWITDPNYMAFQWADGRWFRTQLLNLQYPDCGKVLETAWRPAGAKVTDETRKAIDDLAKLSPDVVTLNALGFHGKTDQGEYSHDCAMPELEGVVARWNPATLQGILAVAETWHPAAYPRPVPFSAKGLRGVAMGRT